MTPAEFAAALDRLGMSARGYATMTGRPPSTVANWTRRDTVKAIPAADAAWIKRRLRDIDRDPPPNAARLARDDNPCSQIRMRRLPRRIAPARDGEVPR